MQPFPGCHSSSTLCRLVVTTAQGKILGNILTPSTGVQVEALDEYSKFLLARACQNFEYTSRFLKIEVTKTYSKGGDQ
jgi:hypothetical protein